MVRNTDKPKSYEAMTKRERSDLRRAIATQNKRIDRLEKSGLASSSAAYRYLEAQHEAGANWLYKDHQGHLRFKANISKMSAEKIDQVRHEVQNYHKAKTSTVTGTRATNRKMVDSFNKRLEEMGIDKRVQSSREIANLYENALFKEVQSQFYTDAIKIYYQAKKDRDTNFLESITKAELPPDDIQVLMDEHKAYEQAARGYLTKQQVQDILIEYAPYHTLTPEDFHDLLKNIKKHTEDGDDYLLNVSNELAYRW